MSEGKSEPVVHPPTGTGFWLENRDLMLPLGIAVGLHLVLSLTAFLPVMHTGGDNAAYLTLASSLLDGGYRELWNPGAPPHTKYPPGFPIALAALMALGFKTFSAFKIVPVAFTALSTALCFLWVRRLHSALFAGVVASLFGASSAVLFASHWILSDPMFVALTLGCLWLLTRDARTTGQQHPEKGDPAFLPLSSRRLRAGLILAVLAYFTRSAGLPLVLAVGLWLGTRRRFKSLAAFGTLFAVPAILWWLRDAQTGHDYVSEFWSVNPYAPELGTIGFFGLLARMSENLWMYAGDFMPAGLTGLGGPITPVVGLPLAALALYGWIRRMRGGAGVAEWFALLYTGLILVWPAVWSGDRFALPLFPLALLYAGETTLLLAETVMPGKERWGVGAVAAVLGALMGASWFASVGPAMDCRTQTRANGPWGCYGQNVRDFGAMALWAGEHLAEDEVVITRKPRLFYLLSGLPSVTFPFNSNGQALLAQADSLGSNYVVRGQWDRATEAYVDPVLALNPERFCRAAGLRTGGGAPTFLLAVLPPGAPTEPEAEGPVIGECLLEGGTDLPSAAALASNVVPILR